MSDLDDSPYGVKLDELEQPTFGRNDVSVESSEPLMNSKHQMNKELEATDSLFIGLSASPPKVNKFLNASRSQS